ncbi:FAD-binding protein, partial [Pseudomonas sp. HAR-UPW-AIA-41]|uniref:FAD-binding protein n=1 Tax=Pseudomonas sp. HAR-UPW-AIA-41 TaxID=1985301 RepID=UPI001C470934
MYIDIRSIPNFETHFPTITALCKQHGVSDVNGETKGLVSEAVRGAGGVLVDDNGNRLMEHVHPLKDLAPRHITAYEIYKARASGKGVYIDIRSIPNFETHFPTITALCKQHGVS